MAIKKGIKLTTGADSLLDAKDTDDIFIAKVLGNSNTFQSGDEIDGGKGTDTLNIVLGNESGFAISAETTGVEVVSVRSQSNNGGDASAEGNSGDNNVSSYESEDGDADENTIDAQDMEGVKEFWNTDSRSDLVIEDVRIGGIANPAKNANGQIVTENVTIGWKNTDPSSDGDKVDYHVFFSPESLRKTDGASTISLQWMDTRAATDSDAKTTALENLNYQGIKLKIGGETKEISSDAINNAKTYDALIKAFNAAFKEAGVAVTATKGTTFKATDTKTSVKAEGSNITLSANNGQSLSFIDVVTKGSVPTDFGAHSNPIGVNVPGFITSKVVLDNVGRESEAGDLVIGSMSTRSGVEKFKVDVLRTEGKNVETMGNWVASMSSTNEKLQEVVITKNDGAYLYVGTGMDATGNNLTVDRSQPDFVNTDGLIDVRVFDASKMTGDVKVGATLANTDGKDATDTSTKYLLSSKTPAKMSTSDKAKNAYYDADDTDNVDTLNDGYVEGDGFVDFNYSTGSGNDTVNLAIIDECDVNINTGAGNDKVQLNVGVVVGGNASINNIGGQIKINLGSGVNELTLSNESKLDLTSTKDYDESKEDYSDDIIVIDTSFGTNTINNFAVSHDSFDFSAYKVSGKNFGGTNDGSIALINYTDDSKTETVDETKVALEKLYAADAKTTNVSEDHIVINSNDGKVYYSVDGTVSLVGTLAGIDLTTLTAANFA